MTATVDTSGAGREDPLYNEGLAHLQGGKWAEALKCFEALAPKYPDSPAVRSALEQARFKARLDATAGVRARRWVWPWQRWAVGSLLVVVVIVVAAEGLILMQRQVRPVLEEAQLRGQVAGLLGAGNALLQAENYDAADGKYREALALGPDSAEAQAGLQQVAEGRAIFGAYTDGVARQQAGDLAGALDKLGPIVVQRPAYRDVSVRIGEIKQELQLGDLFRAAEADLAAGKYADALAKYKQVKAQSATYQRDPISGRLFTLYMALGRDLVQKQPPAPELLPQAVNYFAQALALQPTDVEASAEHRLANLYVSGQASYTQKQWDDAVSSLRAIFDERPGYLGGKLIVDPLYDAYIHSGDASRDAADYPRAWEQYRRASELPVADTALARARMDAVFAFLTPTPTPANTPTTTPIPTPTAYVYVPPTAIPSATPPPPLSTFRNQILFWTDREDQPGLWVMNPDGGNRRFLGNAGDVRKQYDDLRTKEALSPDGRYRVYATSDQSTSVQIWIQGKDQNGVLSTWQVSNLTKMSYDPVWSPDGSLIAFVSTELTSDDIWTIQPDGDNRWNRTPNKWEWDKHPSFSPDSQRIVFWTNREGTKQLYIMDRDGKNQRNISKVAWDEYDPLWVK